MPRLRSSRNCPAIDVLNEKNIADAKPENDTTIKRYVLKEKNRIESKAIGSLFYQPLVNLKDSTKLNDKDNQIKNVKTLSVSKENRYKHSSKMKTGRLTNISQKTSTVVVRENNMNKISDDLNQLKELSGNKKQHTNNLKKSVSCLEKENMGKVRGKRVMSSKRILKKNLLPVVSVENIVGSSSTKVDVRIGKIKTPIYKKKSNLKFKAVRKRRYIDVYDIGQDEDMSHEELIPKKKKIVHLKKNITKKKICAISTPKQKDSNKQALLKSAKNKIQAVMDNGQNPLPSLKSIPHLDECVTNVRGKEDSFLKSPVANENEIITAEPMDFDPPVMPIEADNNVMIISRLADEIEKSFLVPKLTSTPDHSGAIRRKNYAPNLKDVSCIPDKHGRKHVIVETPVKSIIKGSVDNDITLFESPTKEEKVRKEQDITKKNLFPEPSFSPDKLKEPVQKVKESVQISNKKAYHTPDHFKAHLIRTKRLSAVVKKRAPTKEDLLIEKLTQHFDEISGTDLCIE